MSFTVANQDPVSLATASHSPDQGLQFAEIGAGRGVQNLELPDTQNAPGGAAKALNIALNLYHLANQTGKIVAVAGLQHVRVGRESHRLNAIKNKIRGWLTFRSFSLHRLTCHCLDSITLMLSF
jgi:hypothetical protein